MFSPVVILLSSGLVNCDVQSIDSCESVESPGFFPSISYCPGETSTFSLLDSFFGMLQSRHRNMLEKDIA